MSKRLRNALTPDELDLLSRMPRPILERSNGNTVARLQRLDLIMVGGPGNQWWVLSDKGERFVHKKPAARAKSAPTCKGCGKPLRPFVNADVNPQADRARRPPEQTADNQPPTRGAYGDNAFCGINCGWKFAIRALAAVDGVEGLLLPGHTPTALAAEHKDRVKRRRQHEREQREKYAAQNAHQQAREQELHGE